MCQLTSIIVDLMLFLSYEYVFKNFNVNVRNRSVIVRIRTVIFFY